MRDILGPWETVVHAWKVLRRMSTALKLLLALTVATIIATFIPQEPVIPETVENWRDGTEGPGELTAEIFDRLGLFDLFGAWWWNLLIILLVVSLTGCLVPRVRAFIKVARRPPAAGRNLRRLQHHVEVESGLPPDEALDKADTTLQKRRIRRRRIPAEQAASGVTQIAAERGHWREGGSIVFHISFYVIIIGAIMGHTLGFEGHVNVVEGDSFADTRVAYGRVEPGRWFPDDGHRGFVLELEEFTADYLEMEPDTEPGSEPVTDGEGFASGGAFSTFLPAEFMSRVNIRQGGEMLRTDEHIRVNHPIRHDGMTIYQIRFGMAPHVRVTTEGGTVLFEDSVVLTDAGGFVWQGAAAVAREDPQNQIAMEVILLPDYAFNEQGMPVSQSPEPDNPRLAVVVWFGELGLERPDVPLTEFRRDTGNQIPMPVILEVGEDGQVEGLPLNIAFDDLSYWSGFQVSHERGRVALVAGGVLMMVGLVPSLFSYRRRVWVEAHPSDRGAGSRVVVAGVALARHEVFGDAFDDMAAEIAENVGAEPPGPQGRDVRSGVV